MDTAMKNGVLKEFSAIHVETTGETQAHHSCGFFSWHRRLLLALESYLRDQNPRFACVMVPYFDVQTADMTTKPVPSGAGFASFMNIVHNSNDYATFLESIQYGVHNEIHNAVGGIMSTFASPRDPFFYSWHAAIDMYLYTYHMCNFDAPLSEAELLSAPKAFAKASDSCAGVAGIGPDAKIVQNVMVDGKLVDVAEHPTLGRYFKYAGDEMWNYGDVTQLQDYSYSYYLPEIITQQLLSNTQICAGFNAKRPDPDTTTSPTLAPATATSPASSPSSTISPLTESSGSGSFRGSYADDSSYDSGDVESPEDVGYGYNFTEPGHTGIYVVDNSSSSSMYDNTPTDANSGDYWEWTQTTYDGLYERLDGKVDLVLQQMHYAECEAFNKAHGVEDFSADFVQNFHLASNRPICGKKVDDIESGDVVVACTSDNFKPEDVEFADENVIEEIKRNYVPTIISGQYLDSEYLADAQKKATETPVGDASSQSDDYATVAPYNTPTPAPTTVDDAYDSPTPAPTSLDEGYDTPTPATTNEHKLCE
ncbi:hypothetical protein BBO99_00004395 [Phytophthora kernoviae]|uniref:Tyrosinase copper-binding domain-containing protein n=2 Tax=Phytophthora kernoviae TaxID=325452 RepID=A0A3R7JUU1_9STRA|nr:hypothetical protein G195_005730 [Phytophthora kernoviae 00238/432]KAG2524269.1 hypothetical protein JM16_005046 [Phytophthora kernoviae]KAG2526080.1 hypothetical protein JM18_004548 [Phytophthora kernoviae]RLN15322.1 hypothetical protein BBI17_004566 [Phytophthora kernoviae]RLN80597.1 hypothetical protein BBO99_00004395 [Phytophthora kernoviae]